MEQNKKGKRGGITVFLSLTLLVILALAGTMAEVTRGKVCQVYSRRTLGSASDSLLTEYSRPLYEQYQLFFIEDAGKSFEKSIAEYAADTLEPDSISEKSTDLYAGTLTDVKVDAKRYVGDDGCEAMKEQICTYMKRRLAADVFDKFRGKAKPAESLERTAGELEKKAEEEKEAAKWNTTLLELMKLVDGVSCSDGKITGRKYFVKMFCSGEKRRESLGIAEESVWGAIKENVIHMEGVRNDIYKDKIKRKAFLTNVREADKCLKKAQELVSAMGKDIEKSGISPRAADILSSNHRVLLEIQKILQKDSVEEAELSVLKQLWRRYDTTGIVFDYTGIGTQGGAENPLDHFKETISGGVSKLVIKQDLKLSEKNAANADHYRKLYEGKSEQEDYSEAVQGFANSEEIKLQGAVKDLAHISTTDFMLVEYMKRYFSSIKKVVDHRKRRLEYEWEYIVCGGNSDKKNVEQVLNRIVLMRTVINSGVLFASASRRETTHAAALAVVGFSGLEPLVRFTQTVFTVLWGMTESLVDVAAILQEKKVPLIKTEKDIKVDFADIFRISRPYIMDKVRAFPDASQEDFGYEQYLMLFLAAGGSDVMCYRMMDLMEWNIKDNDFSGFQFGSCVDSFMVSGTFSFQTKFFRFPYIQKMLDRKQEEFNRETRIYAGYSPQRE